MTPGNRAHEQAHVKAEFHHGAGGRVCVMGADCVGVRDMYKTCNKHV